MCPLSNELKRPKTISTMQEAAEKYRGFLHRKKKEKGIEDEGRTEKKEEEEILIRCVKRATEAAAKSHKPFTQIKAI